MAEKKKTPLQEAIERLDQAKESLGQLHSGDKLKYLAAGYQASISHLTLLLPKEKEFAKDMYLEGMIDHGYDNAKFFELYKQYEP